MCLVLSRAKFPCPGYMPTDLPIALIQDDFSYMYTVDLRNGESGYKEYRVTRSVKRRNPDF